MHRKTFVDYKISFARFYKCKRYKDNVVDIIKFLEFC